MSNTIKFRCIDDTLGNLLVVDSVSGTTVYSTVDSTNVTSGGALTVAGGLSVGKKMYLGNNLNVTGDINFTGGLYQNGVPFVSGGGGGGGTSGGIVVTAGSQWGSGGSGEIWYTGGNVGIKTTSPSVALDVSGNIKTDALLYNLGGVVNFTGSFAASKDISTPTDIIDLNFSSYNSFIMTCNVNLVTNTQNLNAQYYIEGTNTSNGWVINDSSFGDQIGVSFMISPAGQIRYTSDDYILWVSTTINYHVTAVQNSSNVSGISISSATSGNVVLSGKLNITDTTDANGATSASLVLSGGLSTAKSLLVGGNLNIAGLSNQFSGTYLAVNGNVSPIAIDGLVFPNAAVRSFRLSISIDITKSDSNLYALKTFTGIQTQSGWQLTEETSTGDSVGFVFTIDSNGQVFYTSTELLNWLSTTMNYSSIAYNVPGNYNSLPIPITNQSIILPTVSIASTNRAATNSTSAALSISGGVSIGQNAVIANGLSYAGGVVTNFGGSFSAAIGVTGNVTGLVFPNDIYASFTAIINVKIVMQTNTLVGQYTIEGTQTGSGWVINDSIFGDSMDIIFTIDSDGQIKYTSDIYPNWISTTMNYQATGINAYSNINNLSVPNITSGNITVSGNLNIQSTADANTTSSASLVIAGGLTVGKTTVVGNKLYVNNSVNIATTSDNSVPSVKLNVQGVIFSTGLATTTTSFDNQQNIYIPVDLTVYKNIEIILDGNFSGTTGSGRHCTIGWSSNGVTTTNFTDYSNIVTRNPSTTYFDSTNVLFYNVDSNTNDAHCTIKIYKASITNGRNAIDIRGSYAWSGTGQSRIDATGYSTTLFNYVCISVPSGTNISGNYNVRNFI